MRHLAIEVAGLSKSYRVWNSPRDMVLEVLTGRRRHLEFAALSQIGLKIPQGSVVGIVGRNGAGKSTLLRIVAGTLDATTGTISVKGRISAILELGTGFHGEYSGRQNVFLGGLCLGLNRNEIAERFDEIVAFSELGDFIDQPFRTYSSGMQARLTFAVATCVDPDVLIIDEALSVGDARFQLKSFDRIRSFKERGKSILLVSHSMPSIVAVCDRAVLLEKGCILADGNPSEVCNLYHELLFSPAGKKETSATASREMGTSKRGEMPVMKADDLSLARAATSVPEAPVESASERPELQVLSRVAVSNSGPKAGDIGCIGNATSQRLINAALDSSSNIGEQRYGLREAEITAIRLIDRDGRTVQMVQSLGQYKMICRIVARKRMTDLCFGLVVRDVRGVPLFGWDMMTGGLGPLETFESGEEREIALSFRANLPGGHYFITVALAHWNTTKEDVRFDAHDLVVEPTPKIFSDSLVNLEVALDQRYQGDLQGWNASTPSQ